MKIELQKACFLWARMTRLEEMDQVLLVEGLQAQFPAPPKKGWLKTCREGKLLGQNEMASRLGLSRQAYAKLELNEVHQVITLESLRRAAETMDCELVYWIRPKQKMKFSALLWEQILPHALKLYKSRMRSHLIQPMILARLAFNLFKDRRFRREMKWVRNSKA
jgi:transcriptional regulator with XRE-family HTH domain